MIGERPGSSVGTATAYWLDGRAGMKDLCLLHGVQTGSGAYPASFTMDTRKSFSRNKSDHSSPSGADVKKYGAILSFPLTSSWRDS
jgi:hypothetical protein